MTADLISDKAPLFYYSFRQVRTTSFGQEETAAANKVIIRKNKDYKNDGLQFLIYSYDRNGRCWQSESIEHSLIDRDAVGRIDFFGKGQNKDGIVVDNMFGVLLYKKDLPELAFAKKGEKDILWYLNFYSEYNDDVFEISQSGVAEFIRSTSFALQKYTI